MEKLKVCIKMLWIVLIVAAACEAAISSPEQNLLDYLMMNSSDKAMPIFERNTTIHIEIGLELIQILEVNTPQQMIKILAWMRMSWKNELLVWDPKQFNGITTIRLSKDSIWQPDVTLYNALDISEGEKKYEFPPTPIIAKHDGTHRYAYPFNQAFSCTMNPGDFPTDKHTCTMEFGSWVFDEKQMSLQVEKGSITNEYITSGEWELLEVKQLNYSQKYDCCPVPYSKVEFQFTIKRKHLFYVITTYLPCSILMLCLLLGHLLPAQSGEKVTLSLSVLLAFFVFLQVTSGHVPRAEEISSLGLTLFLALIGITFSTFITCLVLNLHFKSPGNDAMPSWLLRLHGHLTRTILKMGRNQEDKEKSMKGKKGDHGIILVKPASQSFHSSARDENVKEVRLVRSVSVQSYKNHGVREIWTSRRRKRKINAKLKQLLVLTKEIRAHQEEWMSTDEVNNWQRLALLIDRSAFVVYSCATFVSAVVFLY